MSSHNLESLIHRHLDGAATGDEVAELSERLESDAEARLSYLHMARIHATLAADGLDEPSAGESESRFVELLDKLDAIEKRPRLQRFMLSTAAIAAAITLVVGILVLRPQKEPQIAAVTSISGEVQWIGNGGEVDENLEVGVRLSGGTLASTSADS